MGRLYGFTSTGAKLSPNSLGLGDGSPFGGIVLPPIVDSSNGFVYAVSGTNNASAGTPAGQHLDFYHWLAEDRAVGLELRPVGVNLSLPTFNTSYFSSSTSANWAILSCGYDVDGLANPAIRHRVQQRSRDEQPLPRRASRQFQIAPDVEACSPLTGFTNIGAGPPFTSPTDWLFLGLSGGNLYNFNLNGTTGSAGFREASPPTASFSVAAGSSGIIPDNESTDAQASSIYFSGLGTQACTAGGTGYCAVKLTQAGLN